MMTGSFHDNSSASSWSFNSPAFFVGSETAGAGVRVTCVWKEEYAKFISLSRKRGSQWGDGFYDYRLKFGLFYGYRLIFYSYG